MLDLDTGKYAVYIWPAYGVTLLVFVAMTWASLGFSRRWRRRAEELKTTPERDAAK